VARTPHIVGLATGGMLVKAIKSVDEIKRVNVVSDLFALVAEDRVFLAGGNTFN